LPPIDETLEGPTVLQGTYIAQRHVEPAGDVYELYLMRRLGLLDASDSDEDQDKENAEEAEAVNKEKLNEKRKKAKIANKDDIMKKLIFKNHYHALGLEHLSFEATIDDVRKAYKIKVLSHHPDKFEDGAYDEAAKQQWLSIQDAYETLVDPEKKKKYDSTMEFDDSIPANKDYDDPEFFEVFGACFGRNAMFSEKKPVPNLGDLKTPISKVIKFYDFWNAFKSWRDFTVEDEYDLDQAENRYERRYMERENKKMKQHLLKDELARVKKLVNLARAKDPRIKKHEAEEKEKLEKAKEEKRLEKVKRREDEERRKAEAIEETRQKQLKEQEEIRKKDDEIKAVKQAKKNRLDEIKSLLTQKVCLPEYGPTFVDFFFSGVTEDEQNKILETLRENHDIDTMREFFKDFVAEIKERQSPQKKTAPMPVKEKKLVILNKWAEDEIALLTKGMLKYPAGIGSRWEKITGMIGGTKTIHEVTAMAKELSIKNVRGDKNIINTMEEVMKEKTGVKATEPTKKAEPTQASPVDKDQTPSSSPAEWTQPQQKALEAAMKQFPATMDKKERWNKIAEAIPGKTPKDCVDRVKEIKEKLSKKPV
jgi:DnaJ family protein C protein 2